MRGKMKYTEKEYIESGFYDGDMDVEISNEKVKVVKCRKPHKCNGGCNTEIQIGEHALSETGFMDGNPISCYTCIPCLDKWLDELHEYEDEDEDAIK